VKTWKHPDSYFGYSPTGHFVIMGKHRDSDALTRSNWDAAIRILSDAWGEQIEEFAPDGYVTKPDAAPAAYTFSASHWAVGWCETLLVRPDAPERVLEAARDIEQRLESYPVLDESAYSELEWNEAADLWEALGVKGRLEVIKRHGGGAVSIFAARRGDEMPRDDNGAIFDYLRSP